MKTDGRDGTRPKTICRIDLAPGATRDAEGSHIPSLNLVCVKQDGLCGGSWTILIGCGSNDTAFSLSVPPARKQGALTENRNVCPKGRLNSYD
jgi:hypothetical protein